MQTGPASNKLFVAYYWTITVAGFALLIHATPGLNLARWPLLLLWLILTAVTDASPVYLPNGGYITVASTLDYAGILIFGPVATAWSRC